MILTRDKILKAVKKGKIKITPFNEKNVGPASIDLTLGDTFRVFKKLKKEIVLGENIDYKAISTVQRGTILLKPGAFVHGITGERVSLPDNICGLLSGRSTFARMGVLVHATANLIQPGINNKQVLEIKNVSQNTLILKPGLRLCQLTLIKTEGKAKYQTKYRDQIEV